MLAPLLCFMAATSNTLFFPEVPLDLGIRHIHTPEHFAVAHGLTLPGFRLVASSPPVLVQNYTLIAFRFTTLFGREHSARMFTNDKCKSHLLFQEGRNDRAYLLATLDVTRCGKLGHAINLRGTLLREPSVIEKMLGPFTVTRDGIFQAIMEGYSVRDEDENLRLYRRMVLYGARD